MAFHNPQILESFECRICGALRNLVPFVQIKKREKRPWRSVNFSLKLTIFNGCFSRFLNCAKHINIINVYVPTSERAKKFPGEMQKMYNDLNKLCKEIDKISTSITIIAGYFNAKIGKRNGSQNCISQWSRGRRNERGSKLAEFCIMNNKVIAGSCFQHPAKHITTWFQKNSSS